MSRRDLVDIAVVGSGVVGAAAALAFARDGWSVALLEAREPPRWREDAPDLRVYALAPDGMALFDTLDVGASIRDARAYPYRGMEVWDAAGDGRLCFDADRFARRELGWIVENGLLVDRLWQALQREDVALHVPASVAGLEQDATRATLRLEDGRRLQARLVVAADGAASALRAFADIDAPVHDYAQGGLVAYVDTDEPLRATCYQRFLPTGPLALLPVGSHRASIVWSAPIDEAKRLRELDDDALSRALTDASGARLGTVRPVSARAVFPLRRQLAARYREGRLLLVGDAAHVVHPLAGQGVNLGLRDVAALRAALPRPGRDVDPATSRLQRWARARRSACTRAAMAFETINRAFSNDAALPTLLRGPLLGLAGRLPPLQHALWREAAGL
ncbi:FAD-dependent oxidoreductase [Lysobacter sp. TY2-98]|uniref:FAD-dependent oxidoreductase n=1 Tax=Lysobacter sp. TY2-98 TaxID=2290922 RepID=UPI000E1FF994|nr:FAD-dependent oxidoreductase [Lysobacter sp. TY2-98]AXK72605.1 FAD-dependent oxidoreductase [Lysobacter sp. TY2-98]